MKAIILWALLAGVVVFAAACYHGHRNRIFMSDDKNRVEIVYDGDIKFNDDETAIASISQRGYLRYRHNDDQLLAGNDSGVVKYELSADGKPLDAGSPEGKAFLARAIRGMIDMGFDIDGRIDRLYRKGGYPALLSAADSIESDYVQGRYLERILSADSLPPMMVAGVITRIREHIGGDYDKERLLSMVDTSYLKNDSVAMGYLATVKGIGGDYEKSQALQHFLRMTVPDNRYIGFLGAVRTLGADYERGQVLQRLIDQSLYEGAPFDSLLSVVNETQGDYERGNLLKQIAHKDIRKEQSWAELIRATATMNGDYEKGNLLVEIGQRLPKTDSLKAVYMTAAKTVHSDVDYGKVVRAAE